DDPEVDDTGADENREAQDDPVDLAAGLGVAIVEEPHDDQAAADDGRDGTRGLHEAQPGRARASRHEPEGEHGERGDDTGRDGDPHRPDQRHLGRVLDRSQIDRKSTRLHSSHVSTSYAVFRLTKKKDCTAKLAPRRSTRPHAPCSTPNDSRSSPTRRSSDPADCTKRSQAGRGPPAMSPKASTVSEATTLAATVTHTVQTSAISVASLIGPR